MRLARMNALVMALALTTVLPAAAQDEDEAWLAGEEGDEAEGEEAEPEAGEATPGGEDDAWLEGKEVKEVEAPEEDKTYQLKEEPKKWYYALGGRIRYLVVPGSEIEWFPVERAPTVQGYTTGIEAVFRRDGLSIVPHISFGQIIGEGTFQEDGDPIEDVEWWDINLKLLMIGVEFYGSVNIRDWVQYYYGAGIAFFFRLGDDDMVRSEAYTDADGWHACDRPGAPDPVYCETSGGHYDQNWKGWGADPFYLPYINVVPLGFRFKPIPNLYVTFDAGLVLPVVPTFGIRAGYIF